MRNKPASQVNCPGPIRGAAKLPRKPASQVWDTTCFRFGGSLERLDGKRHGAAGFEHSISPGVGFLLLKMKLDGERPTLAQLLELNRQLRAGYKGSYAFREKIDVEGLNHPKRMFDLTEGLIRRQYTDADIQGILGGNFMRVLSQIWT